MAYEKGFEKKTVENQVLTLNALDRIESLSERTTNAVESVLFDVSKKITTVQVEIKNELKKQTGILIGISKKLDGYKGGRSESQSPVDALIKAAGAAANKDTLTGLSYVIGALGGAFFLLGKGLQQMAVLNEQQIWAIGGMTFAMFSSLAMVFHKDVDVSIVDAIKMALILPLVGRSIVGMAEEFSAMPDVKPKHIATAIALSASFMPIAYSIAKAYEWVDSAGLVNFFTTFALVGLVFLGELAIFPVIGRLLAVTSEQFANIVVVSPQQLASAIGVAAALAPVAYYTAQIMDTMFGGGLFGLIKGMVGMPFMMAASVGVMSMLPLMAAVISMSAMVLSTIPALSLPQLGTAIMVGLAMIPISMAFVRIMDAIGGGTMQMAMEGLLSSSFGKFSPGMSFGKFQQSKAISLGLTVVALPLMTAGIVAAAFIISTMPTNISLKQLLLAGLLGFALVPVAAAFSMVTIGISVMVGLISKLGGSLIKGLVISGMAMFVMATSIVGVAHVFALLPDAYKSPPLKWLVKVGIGMTVFSMAMIAMAVTAKLVGPTAFALGVLGFAMSALAIVGIAHIFSLLPDSIPEGPGLKWIIKMGLGLGAVGAVIALMGGLIMLMGGPGIGAMAFLLGAAALQIAALSIVGIAHILQLAPAGAFGPGGIFYQVADTMEYFAKTVIDVFLYLMNGFIPIAEKVVGVFSMVADIFGKVVDTLIGAVERLGGVFMSGLKGIGDFLKGLAEIGGTQLIAIGAGLISVAAGISAVMLATIGAGVGGVINETVGMVSKGIGALSDAVFGKEEGELRGGPLQVILTLADNAKAITMAGDALESLAGTLSKFRIKEQMHSLINTYAAVRLFYDKKEGMTPKKDIFTYLVDPVENFTNKLENLSKQANSVEKFANAVGKLNTEMGGFRDVVNTFDVEKLNATNEMVQSLTNFASSSQTNNIKALGEFAQSVTDQAVGMYSKIFGNGEEAATEVGGEDQNFAAAIIALNSKMNELQGVMSQVVDALGNELDVRVVNQDDINLE